MKQLQFIPENDSNIIHSGTVVIMENGVIEEEIEISDWDIWKEIMGFILFKCTDLFDWIDIDDLSYCEIKLLDNLEEL